MSQDSVQKTEGRRANARTNISGPVLIGLFVLIAGFGGFLLWAFTAPLDEGVVASGTVTVKGSKKTIQHLDGGIVSEILVKDGDVVKPGQALIRLDKTQFSAELGVLKAQFLSESTVEARLLAERDHRARIEFPQELLQSAKDPVTREQMHLQQQLFETRKRALAGEVAIMNQSIESLESQIRGLEAVQGGRAEQIRLLTDELSKMRKLYEQGYVPHTRIFELERTLVDVTSGRDSDAARIVSANSNISELRLRILQRQQDFQKEVETQLGEKQRNVSAMKEQMVAAEAKLARTEITAPNGGIVLGLKLHTLGGVIRPGDALLDLVPEDAGLVIEAHVQPQDRDKVYPGLKADVRFVAFNQRKTPVVGGDVFLVSADRFTDERSGIPYYLAKVSVSPENLGKLGSQHIQPGMPVDVIIKTGERTFMNYLIKPILDRMARSLKEE